VVCEWGLGGGVSLCLSEGWGLVVCEVSVGGKGFWRVSEGWCMSYTRVECKDFGEFGESWVQGFRVRFGKWVSKLVLTESDFSISKMVRDYMSPKDHIINYLGHPNYISLLFLLIWMCNIINNILWYFKNKIIILILWLIILRYFLNFILLFYVVMLFLFSCNMYFFNF